MTRIKVVGPYLSTVDITNQSKIKVTTRSRKPSLSPIRTIFNSSNNGSIKRVYRPGAHVYEPYDNSGGDLLRKDVLFQYNSFLPQVVEPRNSSDSLYKQGYTSQTLKLDGRGERYSNRQHTRSWRTLRSFSSPVSCLSISQYFAQPLLPNKRDLVGIIKGATT